MWVIVVLLKGQAQFVLSGFQEDTVAHNQADRLNRFFNPIGVTAKVLFTEDIQIFLRRTNSPFKERKMTDGEILKQASNLLNQIDEPKRQNVYLVLSDLNGSKSELELKMN